MDSLPLMTLVSVYFSLSWNIITAPVVLRAGPKDAATDGELYLQNIANGKAVPENPGYLLFTAPYKLTTVCATPPCLKVDYPNLWMAFPMIIGDKRKNRKIFSTLYPKDTDGRTMFKTSPGENSYTTIVCPNTTCPVDPRVRSTAAYYKNTVRVDNGTNKPAFRLAYDPRRTVKEAQVTNKRPEQTTPQLLEMRESDYKM